MLSYSFPNAQFGDKMYTKLSYKVATETFRIRPEHDHTSAPAITLSEPPYLPDYCHGPLTGVTASSLAPFILKQKSDHVTLLLKTLQQLPRDLEWKPRSSQWPTGPSFTSYTSSPTTLPLTQAVPVKWGSLLLLEHRSALGQCTGCSYGLESSSLRYKLAQLPRLFVFAHVSSFQ